MSQGGRARGDDLIIGRDLFSAPVRELDEQSLRKVALLVAGHARNVEEARDFLDQLGLINESEARIEEDLSGAVDVPDSTAGRASIRSAPSPSDGYEPQRRP